MFSQHEMDTFWCTVMSKGLKVYQGYCKEFML